MDAQTSTPLAQIYKTTYEEALAKQTPALQERIIKAATIGFPDKEVDAFVRAVIEKAEAKYDAAILKDKKVEAKLDTSPSAK